MAANLLEKIDDEFLSCMICLERFSYPKTLSCLHTFCDNCIKTHYRKNGRIGVLTCPACRLDTKLDVGGIDSLPSNFFVAGLCEVFDSREKSGGSRRDVVCCGCDGPILTEKSFCTNCRDFLCETCATHHHRTKLTKTHRVIPGADMDSLDQLVDERSQSSATCKLHANEPLKLYCENCRTPLCVVCSVTSHAGHTLNDANASAEKIRNAISQMLSPAQQKVSEYQFVVDGARSAEELLVNSHSETKRAIDETTDQLIADMATALRREAEGLKSQADDVFAERQREIIEYREKTEREMEGARNACDYSGKIVRFGSVSELLFANKNLMQKLNEVSSAKVDPFGKTGKIQFSRPQKPSSFPQRRDIGTISLILVEQSTDRIACSRGKKQRKRVPKVDRDIGGCGGMATPMPAAPDTVQPGNRVIRGPDWVWGDQDGGPGSTGTVLSVQPGGWATVRWQCGNADKYRMGSGNRFDLKLV